jgi:hypothetical protein
MMAIDGFSLAAAALQAALRGDLTTVVRLT